MDRCVLVVVTEKGVGKDSPNAKVPTVTKEVSRNRGFLSLVQSLPPSCRTLVRLSSVSTGREAPGGML